GVDRDLETVCLRCLDKDPQRRYGSAEALAEDLESWLDGRPIRARPVGPRERLWRWCRRNPLAASLMGLVAVLPAAAAPPPPVAAGRRAAGGEGGRAARGGAGGRAEGSRHRLVRTYVASGARLMDEGDLLGSLVWFTEALRLDAGKPQAEEVHRHRLGAVLR